MGSYQMADTVFVLDLGCLRALSYARLSAICKNHEVGFHHVPAPGGPIRIIRMLPVSLLELLLLPSSLVSSSDMRFSSLCTSALRSATALSVMGAIAGCCGEGTVGEVDGWDEQVMEERDAQRWKVNWEVCGRDYLVARKVGNLQSVEVR
jgi:hypothetical protein